MKSKRSEGRVHIDPERCKGCGLCVAVCPKHHLSAAAQTDRRGIRIVRPAEGGRCTACGACYAVCPDAAVTVYAQAPSTASEKKTAAACPPKSAKGR